MKRWLKRCLLAAFWTMAPFGIALAYYDYTSTSGSQLAGTVLMWLNGSGAAQPASASAPVPVSPIAGASAAPFAVGSNSFQFTVTSADQALPTSGSPALVLPGKICLHNPQQTFGSAAANTSYVNVNWGGASSTSSPIEQIAPGVEEVCWYVPTTTAPHLSVNGSAAGVTIGVQQ